MSKNITKTTSGTEEKTRDRVKVRPTVAKCCDREGIWYAWDAMSSFKTGLTIHDHTKNRTFTDKGRMPNVRDKSGRRVISNAMSSVESLLDRLNSFYPCRAIAPVLDKDGMIRILSTTPSMANLKNVLLLAMSQLMEDGMITMDIIDDVLDIHHPAWSRVKLED